MMHNSAHYTRKFLLTLSSLVIFGLIFIYNSTIVSSQQIYGVPYRFVILQLLWTILGLGAFMIFYKFDYSKLSSFSTFLYMLSIVFLCITAFVSMIGNLRNSCDAFIPFVPCINGAYRWFYINPSPLPKIPFVGVLGFQPVELAKLALVLCLTFRLKKAIHSKQQDKDPFFVYLILTGLTSALVYLQPNMSSAILLFGIGTAIYIVSQAPLQKLFILIPVLTLVFILLVFGSSYRRQRLLTYTNNDASVDSGYHIKQIKIALGSGGLFGVGFGQSRQKYQYVPEIASDSIFAIIGEELGLIGTCSVLFGFLLLLYFGVLIAKSSIDYEGKLISVGILSWITLQLFINVSAMLEIIPLTGVPIPFISYGGSSTVFIMAGAGLLASVGKKSQV